MSIQIRDSITPGLARLARKVKDRKPVLEAMGMQLTSIATRSFSDAALRPAPWAPRTSGGANSLLRKSGALWQSIRVTALSANSVTVGTDRVYAAIHQFGGTIKAKPGGSLVFTVGGKKIFAKQVKIPPRPFFPFTPNGTMLPAAQAKIAAVAKIEIAKALREAEGTK